MIYELDESLRRLVLRDALSGSGVDLSFEAPTKDWASRRSVPTVNLYLYDVREDVDRREVQPEEIRDERGRVTGRRPPPRRYRLSYLVSAWTQRPEDEHRLLASLLACFLQSEVLDTEVLAEALANQPHRVELKVAHPAAKDRALADVWTALGGELKPALDLVVNLPFDAQRVQEAGPPVLEPLELRVHRAAPARAPQPEPPPVPPDALPPEPEPEAAPRPAPEVLSKRRWWRT
ncbi:MAG: hypothetical protein JWM06_2271 [Actinomycetia bacterium]|nr:hypothetical protein [Actinomycetes bacterium]